MTELQLYSIDHQLSSLNRSRWSQQYLELQDEGFGVLVSIEIPAATTHLEREAIRADIRGLLRSQVPSRKGDYAWTVAIKTDGEVVDTLMGGSLGDLPEI